MSTLPKVIARAISDNPLMVRRRPTKDLYVPRTIYQSKTVTEPRSSFEEITAQEAREKGFKVDPAISNDKLVKVEWIEDVEKKLTWVETRLQARGRTIKRDDKEVTVTRRRSKPSTMRAELADALDFPVSFVAYDKLQKMIKDETEHWKTHDMGKQTMTPIVLVLLGISEVNEGFNETHKTYTRDVYFIKKFDHHHMVVVDSEDNEIEIELQPGVYQSGVISRFTLFLPSNIRIFDPRTRELLL